MQLAVNANVKAVIAQQQAAKASSSTKAQYKLSSTKAQYKSKTEPPATAAWQGVLFMVYGRDSVARTI